MESDQRPPSNLDNPASSDVPSIQLLVCPICHKQLNNPHLLPCLHVFCLGCLRDNCHGKSLDKFFCPSCVADGISEGQKSFPSRPWHSFERILEQEDGNEELQRRLAELPASETNAESWEKGSNDCSDAGESDSNRKPSILEPPILFPCTMHLDRLADTFCFKCDQLACPKCVSSFHRRCQNFSGLQDAVETKRRQFDSIHDKMAANLVGCEDVVNFQLKRLQEIEAMRTDILIQIKKFRTDLVSSILAKEKSLTQEANRIMDTLKEEAVGKHEAAEKLAKSLQKQMELLDVSFSVKGEGELLPLLPGLITRTADDWETVNKQYSDTLTKVSFLPDQECRTILDSSSLGQIHVDGVQAFDTSIDVQKKQHEAESPNDLDLVLVTSFHGGSCDDVTEPLLTDLIVIANGDVILTDRDNKCVKKFNQTGKLLTRVILDAVPSRIATVSHARAVVSVMNKKSLYFLSLFGTVRVLHTVRVKKFYSFLTSLGKGLLVAGTNLCESIDVLNERGETIRSIFSQKTEKESISRPLYLTPAMPRAAMVASPKGTDMKRTPSDSNNNDHNDDNVNTSGDTNKDISARRLSVNKTNDFNSNTNGQTNTSASKEMNTNCKPSRKSSKKHLHVPSNSKKLAPSSPSTETPSPTSPSTATSSLKSSLSDQDILVSDSGKRVMFRLQQEGTVAFTLRSRDTLPLECPLGVTVHESGLTLLADRDSDCVLLLDKNGNFLKKIVDKQHGLVKPCGIYAGVNGAVALSQVDGTIKIYKTA